MAKFSNKSSVYLQSLTDFINDTKPYHSKLDSVIEEYQFADSFSVKFVEGSSSKLMTKAAWPYNFFSGGNVLQRTMEAKRVVDPELFTIKHLVGSSENTDLVGIPYVYSRKQFDGPGVADAWILPADGYPIPYVEGIDFFQSHGSFEFKIQQVIDGAGQVKPTWSETRTNGILSAATAVTQSLELDATRAHSALNQLKLLVTSLRQYIANYSLTPQQDRARQPAVAAADRLLATLATGVIPPAYVVDTTVSTEFTVLGGDYDIMLSGAVDAGIPAPAPIPDPQDPRSYAASAWLSTPTTPHSTWCVDDQISAYMPPLLHALHRDSDLYESGVLQYKDVTTPFLNITNIVADPLRPVEEWTLTALGNPAGEWTLTGSVSGLHGTLRGGDVVTGPIAFTTVEVGGATPGTQIKLTPYGQIVVGPTAPLETWNLIKVNPLAYTRPVFTSTVYGFIRDQAGVIGQVTVLESSQPEGTIVLTATSATSFALTNTGDVTHTGTVTVNTPYADGRVGFTIVSATKPFAAGDRFLIEVKNPPAKVEDFDLYYGYDLDSFDNPALLYDVGGTIDFKYDSRFTDYDLTAMHLAVAQSVPDGRTFRLMAVPDAARPIATVKRDGSGPTNEVDLNDAGVGPAVLSMPGDPNPAADLLLFYASSFRLEYSDDGFNTVTVAGTVPVGGSFYGAGVGFTLPAGSKPFIAVRTDSGVEGGDVFQFKVRNPLALVSGAVDLIAYTGSGPRLIMHGDSYFKSISAKWTVNFYSSTAYTVNAISTPANLQVSGYPRYGTLTVSGADVRAGNSYRDENVHFTVVPGAGLTAGDSFTFETFTRKPSFLVHGTVSGWQPPAAYDEWYWNGKIGFKIRGATAAVYEKVADNTLNGYSLYVKPNTNDYFHFNTGYVQVVSLRPDAPEVGYTFTRETTGWMVSRSDVGVIGHCPYSTGIFADQYISVAIVDTGSNIVIQLHETDLEFWNAPDAVIVNTQSNVRVPTLGTSVVVKKAEASRLGINLDYSGSQVTVNIAPLAPTAIDQGYIDTSTGTGIPLSYTSPETLLLNSWLPTYTRSLDATNSVAEFEDQVSTLEVYSAATNQLIGRLQPTGTRLQETTVFEFDPTFFGTYLPLNSQANIVTYGNSLDDNLKVSIAERLNVLTSGGVILQNPLFSDTISVVLSEAIPQWSILQTLDETVSAAIKDGPFGGFLPGYANMPYDAEINNVTGYYDLDDPTLTNVQPEIGIPAVGMAMDIVMNANVSRNAKHDLDSANSHIPDVPPPASTDPAIEGAGASMSEALSVLVAVSAAPFDGSGFDTLPLDVQASKTALVFAPVGQTLPATFLVQVPVSSFEVQFLGATSMATPTFTLSPVTPTGYDPALPVYAVQTVAPGQYRFSISNPTQMLITAS